MIVFFRVFETTCAGPISRDTMILLWGYPSADRPMGHATEGFSMMKDHQSIFSVWNWLI